MLLPLLLVLGTVAFAVAHAVARAGLTETSVQMVDKAKAYRSGAQRLNRYALLRKLAPIAAVALMVLVIIFLRFYVW